MGRGYRHAKIGTTVSQIEAGRRIISTGSIVRGLFKKPVPIVPCTPEPRKTAPRVPKTDPNITAWLTVKVLPLTTGAVVSSLAPIDQAW